MATILDNMVELEVLRAVQASLNLCIDEYVAGVLDDNNVTAKVQTKAKIASTARKLQHLVTTPEERMLELGLEFCASVAIRIAIDLDLFTIMTSQSRMSIEELARKTGADPVFLVRVTRTLVAEDYLSEPAVNEVGSTPMCRAMTQPNYRDWIIFNFDVSSSIRAALPAFMAQRHYQDIYDRTGDVMHHLFGTDFYGHLKQNPKHEATFASSMGILSRLPPFVQPCYTFESQDPDSGVAIVDIGGGHGQYLNELLEEQPDLPGRVILQDLESVIASVNDLALNPRIEKQAYNYFTPQPVIGAQFYIMRAVLHNLTDLEGVRVLKNLRAAMVPNYSKLLIHEMVMPASGATRRSALGDINMLMLCGKDRTLKQFTELLNEAGFSVNGIFNASVGNRTIIEAELREG